MNRTQKTASIAVSTGLALVAGWAGASAVYAFLRLRRSARLAAHGHGFETQARAEGSRLLVVGDSSATGAGASSPECSLPGLLARANPSLTVVNRGRPAADFISILDQFEDGERFDAVLVMAGARDAFGLGRRAALRAAIEAVAQRARLQSDVVVFLPPGNLGNLGFLLPPWNWWAGWRSRRLHELIAEVAQANGASYASLLRDAEDDPFGRHPKQLYREGGPHPNDAGYELWQRELETQVQLSARLRRIGRSAAARTPIM
jgi:lysophospholipase L1-like esterase